jgi:Lrp/AsnC family transcriptional regulator, leucine-responsive regulatory protein
MGERKHASRVPGVWPEPERVTSMRSGIAGPGAIRQDNQRLGARRKRDSDASHMDLEDIDLRILSFLQDDARLSNVELAAKVGLSQAPCLRRVRALEKSGVIKSYTALIDEATVALGVTVHIQVRLDLQVAKRFDRFESQIVGRPDVLECYLLTGAADYLLRVAVRDVAAYERFLKESLSRMEGVVSTHSSFGLRVVKHTTSLPLFQPTHASKKAVAEQGDRPLRSRNGDGSHPQLDAIDRHILVLLQENARISNVELANRVGLSPAPCLRRVRVLETSGVIRRYVSLLNPQLVDLPATVWVQIRLDLQTARRFDTFEQQIKRMPEVLECYLMAGEADYLVRVAVRNVATYERFLRTQLSRIEGIVSTSSSFVLRVVKYSTILPIET